MQVNCPHCHQPLIVDAGNAGCHVNCSYCGKQLVLPAMSQAGPQASISPNMPVPSKRRYRTNKYPVLIKIALAFKVFAGLALAGGVYVQFALLHSYFKDKPIDPDLPAHLQRFAHLGEINTFKELLAASTINVLSCGLVVVSLLAVSELIRLGIVYSDDYFSGLTTIRIPG